MTTPMPPAPPGPLPAPVPSGSPVQLTIAHADTYSRGLAVLGLPLLYGRLIALIPVAIVLFFIGIAAIVTAWIMQFAVLFTGRYPPGAHTFVTGYLRLSSRTGAWAFGLVDTYPGFSTQPSPTGSAAPHPVVVSIAHAEQYSRGLGFLGCIFFIGRVIALLPILIVLYILRIVSFLVAWIMQFAVLFTGSYPAGAHDFVSSYLRLGLARRGVAAGPHRQVPGAQHAALTECTAAAGRLGECAVQLTG